MSGDEPLGDSHTNWQSPEESLTPIGMSCRKSHMINHTIMLTTELYNMVQINMKMLE